MDPSGARKMFGLCDFHDPEGVIRATKLLANLDIGGKLLNVGGNGK
jgi:hypothetical protein